MCVYCIVFFLNCDCVRTMVWMHHMDTNEMQEKKLERKYTRMLHAVLHKSWKKHYTKNLAVQSLTFSLTNKPNNIDVYIWGLFKKFPDFCMRALLLIIHTWNSTPFRSNLLWLQSTCIISTTSGRPHGSPLVWPCQWPSSQPLSSPQLSHNDSL